MILWGSAGAWGEIGAGGGGLEIGDWRAEFGVRRSGFGDRSSGFGDRGSEIGVWGSEFGAGISGNCVPPPDCGLKPVSSAPSAVSKNKPVTPGGCPPIGGAVVEHSPSSCSRSFRAEPQSSLEPISDLRSPISDARHRGRPTWKAALMGLGTDCTLCDPCPRVKPSETTEPFLREPPALSMSRSQATSGGARLPTSRPVAGPRRRAGRLPPDLNGWPGSMFIGQQLSFWMKEFPSPFLPLPNPFPSLRLQGLGRGMG